MFFLPFLFIVASVLSETAPFYSNKLPDISDLTVPSFVLFTAPWCISCQEAQEPFNIVQEHLNNTEVSSCLCKNSFLFYHKNVSFLIINDTHNRPDISSHFFITELPSLFFVTNTSFVRYEGEVSFVTLAFSFCYIFPRIF